MKRSPLPLSRMPPSPRTPSVISIPAPATPVGWNCQNSMSSSGMPARAAMPSPSPVLMKALVLAAKMRPAPPVASSVAFAVADQVERHPLDEKVGTSEDVALIERMQHRVSGAIGGGARTLHGFLTEVCR